MDKKKFIYWFDEIGKEHNDIVGKKCANLGEIVRMGLPVPYFFAISIDTYREYINETQINKEIKKYINNFGDLSGKPNELYDQISEVLRAYIENGEIPNYIKKEILHYYNKLCDLTGKQDLAVSVRSAGIESRPGMFETYLNVKGAEQLLEKIKKVWASAYTGRALAFRANKGIPILEDELGVAVVKMVNASSSGICFTVDPVTGDTSKITIEANWGLGEGVVSGGENVDKWTIDKISLQIIEKEIGKKTKYFIFHDFGAGWANLTLEKQNVPCLSDDEVVLIAKLAKKLEEKFESPQDMEWALDMDLPHGQNIFLLQTRPAKFKRMEESKVIADKMLDVLKSFDPTKITKKDLEFKF